MSESESELSQLVEDLRIEFIKAYQNYTPPERPDIYPDYKVDLNVEINTAFILDINNARYDRVMELFKLPEVRQHCLIAVMHIAREECIITKKVKSQFVDVYYPREIHRNVVFRSEKPIEEIQIFHNSICIYRICPNSTSYEHKVILPPRSYYRVQCATPVTIEYDLCFVSSVRLDGKIRYATLLQFDLPDGESICLDCFGTPLKNI
jgi:hypothetical protein